MIALFDKKPIHEPFEDLWDGVFVLPVSLEEYIDLFWSDTATYGPDVYMKARDATHTVEDNGKWFSPPEE